jgi:hypothetical protein
MCKSLGFGCYVLRNSLAEVGPVVSPYSDSYAVHFGRAQTNAKSGEACKVKRVCRGYLFDIRPRKCFEVWSARAFNTAPPDAHARDAVRSCIPILASLAVQIPTLTKGTESQTP